MAELTPEQQERIEDLASQVANLAMEAETWDIVDKLLDSIYDEISPAEFDLGADEDEEEDDDWVIGDGTYEADETELS